MSDVSNKYKVVVILNKKDLKNLYFLKRFYDLKYNKKHRFYEIIKMEIVAGVQYILNYGKEHIE